MNRPLRARLLILLTILVASSGAAAQTPAGPPQRAGDRYKSVRVLADAPATQIIEIMSVIAGSLGVTCAHCHEAEFESDAKPMKQRARDMIVLTRTTDGAFGGKGLITCNTCHQGKPVPSAVARVEQAAWMQPRAAAALVEPLPSAQDVFDRYVRAVGGVDALQRVSSRVASGRVTRDNGRTGPMSGTFTLEQQLPGSARMDTGFSFPPEAQGELTAEFFRPRRARDLAARGRVIGRGRIKSRPTTIVEIANPAGGVAYRLHFDDGDGVLVARESEKPTPLGLLAERHELSDYREVNGVLQPFHVEWMRADYHVTFEISTVK